MNADIHVLICLPLTPMSISTSWGWGLVLWSTLCQARCRWPANICEWMDVSAGWPGVMSAQWDRLSRKSKSQIQVPIHLFLHKRSGSIIGVLVSFPKKAPVSTRHKHPFSLSDKLLPLWEDQGLDQNWDSEQTSSPHTRLFILCHESRVSLLVSKSDS